MKKLTSLLLSVLMCLSVGVILTACGNEEHTHTYKTEWEYDDTCHWHACEKDGCTEISEKAEHTWNEGEITTPATTEADGVKTFCCTVCGKTKSEAVKYVFDDTVSNRVYSYIYDRGIIGVSLNSEGAMLSIDVYDEDDMQSFYSDNIFKPLKFKYDDSGKMTAVAYDYDAIELAVTSYDNSGRPIATAEAEDGESLAFAYNDSAKTTTITFNESEKSYTFDEYNRCILEKSVTGSGNIREKAVTFDGNTGIITEDGEDTEQRVIYENNSVMTKISLGTYGYYLYTYNDKGLCTQIVDAENESDDPSNPAYEIKRGVIEYNAEGKILKRTVYYKGIDDDKETTDREYFYEYGSNGLLLKLTYKDSDYTRITEYEYTDDGEFKSRKVTKYDTTGTVLDEYVETFNSGHWWYSTPATPAS